MTNSRVKIWLRRILILLAFVFAFILVLLYLAPGIALLGANHWYQKQGEGYSLTAKDWTFAPFRTELEFTGLVLEHPGSGSGETRIERVHLDFDPWALFSHQVDVRSLVLDGLKLQADVSEGEEKTIDQTDVKDILLKIAGLNLPVTQLPIKQVTVPAEENISEADDPAANAVSDSSVSDKTVANKETTPTSANPAAAADPGEDIPWLVRVQSLSITANDLNWNVQLAQTLDVASSSGRLSINQINVRDFSTAETDPVDIDINLQLSTEIRAAGADIDVKPMTFSLRGSLDHPLTAPSWQGDIGLSGTDVKANNIRVRLSELSISLDAALNDAFSQLTFDGEVTFADAGADMPEMNAGFSKLVLELDGSLLNNLKELTLNSGIQLNDVRVNAAGLRSQLAELTTQLHTSATDDFAAPQVAGDIQLRGIDAGYQQYQATLDELSLSGLDAGLQQQRLQNLLLRNLRVSSQPGWQSANPAATPATTPAEDGQGGNAENDISAAVTEPAAGTTEPAVELLNLAHYQLSDFAFNQNSLTSGSHDFDGLVVELYKLADGTIKGLENSASENNALENDASEKSIAENSSAESTAAESNKAQSDPASESTDSKPLAFYLAGLHQAALVYSKVRGEKVQGDVAEDGDVGVDGESDTTAVSDSESTEQQVSAEQTQTLPLQNSIIHFTDAAVSPPLDASITLYELAVGEAEGSVAGADAELKQPITLHLLAGLDKYNRIRTDASLSVYERDGVQYPQGTIKAKITQLDLTAFNGYLAQSMGYNLERGMLEADIDVTIDKAKLKGEVKILLRNSRFVPVDEATIDRVSKQISMPVDTALDLLRDGNGNVNVTIPVSGDLTDPNFGLSDLTQQLSVLALKTGAMFYLKQALQPYTTLINLASFAGDYLMKIRLDALRYESGQTELSEEHLKNLNKVMSLMQDKKSLELQACPFVSAEEAETAGDGWTELAKQRGAAVKAWLNEQDEQLTPRITVCKPQKGKNAEVVLGFN
ncbi:MAG: hypothetical protein CMI03_20330 [Oceanospirillaceae bacterium]|uniref:DUF748 domain-containing protein n=3 Tax=unclassified Thalassolituus TaxID=2624967 RepID=UPI000C5AEFDF|nr:DUF748 domain-containing protein [Thalassolituus sp. UBA6592]MAS25266.1 hypothetical protein [Oceanospirillaceae bacterium]MBL34208.1 hypothetical protein [Oceanospirillaceae bacterium]MBS55092.1 hypothetical protein [Oceanospirillaceae bacterium]|tara:strand:- start:887 stop:3883 length:2997 start_codon:yes stop_codon:yes gene_type:complete